MVEGLNFYIYRQEGKLRLSIFFKHQSTLIVYPFNKQEKCTRSKDNTGRSF